MIFFKKLLPLVSCYRARVIRTAFEKELNLALLDLMFTPGLKIISTLKPMHAYECVHTCVCVYIIKSLNIS